LANLTRFWLQAWLVDPRRGLANEATRLDLADKGFRYLLSARSRADLDARLKIFAEDVVPSVFESTVKQDAYVEYLKATRFAPEGHKAFLPGCTQITWLRL
jgi:hypothetical protein